MFTKAELYAAFTTSGEYDETPTPALLTLAVRRDEWARDFAQRATAARGRFGPMGEERPAYKMAARSMRAEAEALRMLASQRLWLAQMASGADM